MSVPVLYTRLAVYLGVLGLGAAGCKSSVATPDAATPNAATTTPATNVAATAPATAAPATAPATNAPATPAAPANPLELGQQFIAATARGAYPDAVALAASTLSAKLTAADWTKAWTTALAAAGDPGAFSNVTGYVDATHSTTVVVRAHYAHGYIEAQLGVADGHISGIGLGPFYVPPDYVDHALFDEVPIAVGSGRLALPGLLTRPHGAGPFPVVVLVQGSGGSNLDEWAPPGKSLIFRDLADGLASRGVAVVRFDKRSWPRHFIALGKSSADFTAQDEYLDPVRDALALVAATPGLDPKRIFILGHSQGGWLLPMFLRDHPEVAGGILAAGNARPLWDLVVDQTVYLTRLRPGVTDVEVALAQQMAAEQATRADAPDLADTTPPEQLPFHLTPRYIKFLRSYDGPAVAAALDKPFLLLQGGREYNVTVSEHEAWKKALAAHKDVTARLYPSLNHLFIAGDAPASPTDLAAGGHVDRQVVEDIAAWIGAH